MSLIAKIGRESVAITGLVTAVIGLLVAFGVDLTDLQIGAIVTALGAVMLVLRRFTTPSSEVAVQVVKGEVIAGSAAVVETGTPLTTTGLGDGSLPTVDQPIVIKPDLLS